MFYFRYTSRATAALFLLLVATACGSATSNPKPDIHKDPDEPSPVACGRNVALLRSLPSLPIDCAGDDECPPGSHCSLDDGQCATSCIPDEGDATGGCPDSAVCDCYGHCDGTGERAPSRGGTLSFTSTAVTLGHPDRGGHRVRRAAFASQSVPATVEVNVSLPQPEDPSGSRITFHASPGLLIRCRPEEAAASRCRLPLQAGEQTIAVQVAADHGRVDATPGPWTLSYTSASLFPRRGSISVLPPPTAREPSGKFFGQATACFGGAAPPSPVPLVATIDKGVVTLRALSAGPWPADPLAFPLGEVGSGKVAYGPPIGGASPPLAHWQAVVEPDGDDASTLSGVARLTFAPQSSNQWCITLQSNHGAVIAMPVAPGGDTAWKRLTAKLDSVPPQQVPAIATAGDHRHQGWRNVARQSAETHNIFADLGQQVGADGRARRAPLLPNRVVFRPTGDTLGSEIETATFFGVRDFAAILSESELQVYDGRNVDDYAGIMQRAWYRMTPGQMYLPCVSGTFPSDGALTKVDCEHVLGPRSPQGRSFDDCRNTDARIWHCPRGICENAPTKYFVWLCPVGLPLPRTLAETVESTLCRAPDDPQDAADGWHSDLLSNQPGGLQSDLLCRRGQPQAAVPLLTHVVDAAATQFDACLDEINRDPATYGADPWRETAANRATCFRSSTFHAALATLLDAPSLPEDAGRLLQHLLRQWLTLHTFLGNEGARRGDLETLVRGEAGDQQQAAQLGLATPYGQVDQTLAEALQFLLGPAVAPVLVNLSPEVLARPDYRINHQVEGSPEDVQRLGLPVAMLDAAASYLRFSAHRLARMHIERRDPNARVEARAVQLGAALQLAGAIRAQAVALRDRATTCGLLSWDARYRAALGELDAAFQRMLQVRDHGTDDWSSFAFGDDEVPLNYSDVAGANSSFFASSDFLFREYATSAVSSARRSLESARGTWAALVSTSQQENEGEEAALFRYGRPLRDLCGLSERDDRSVLDAFSTGALSAASCYLRPGCSGSGMSAAPSCLRGQLGEVAAAVAAARGEVETARIYVADIFSAHERRLAQCGELQADLVGDDRLMRAHEDAMSRRRNFKAVADQAANVAQQTANIGLGDLLSAGACRVIATASHAASLEAGREMESLEASFRTTMALRSNQQRVKACFHEADAKLEGLRSASSQLRQRLLDLETALLRLSNRQEEADRLAFEGVALLANRAARGAPSMAFRGWLGKTAEDYRTQLRAAKHMTYLALRAFEYETQQTSPWKAKVLHATGPSVLEQALLEIHGRNVSRAINGRRPEGHHIRLSLRDDILRLADQTDTPQQKRHGTPSERFSHYLASEASAIFGANGEYLGQGLVFDLPDATTGECAERLTSVAARIEGNFAANGPVSARIKLYKLGLFGSKWCAGRGDADAEAMQWRAKPRSELVSIHTGEKRTLPSELAGYSVANLDAHADANRHQFAAAGFREGSSAELGGQGLYGSYAVVIPPDSAFAPGKVEDVILRFDYVSVDNTISRPGGR